MNGPSGPSGPRRLGLGARHVRRVGPDHVGERVSVRRWVQDPARGPVRSDVVGRLLAHDDEVLMIVDRARQLHVVHVDAVLSSRVVPPHPRLEDEPHVGTEDQPLEREAARVLLLGPDERVLLVAHDQPGRRVWSAPGGGLRPGEDHAGAARRELAEELDVEVEPGPWVWSRDVTFPYRGVWLRQRERWLLARAQPDPDRAPLDDVGAGEARWWSLEQLRTSDEVLAPRSLPDHLETLLRDGPPAEPVDVGE